MPEMSEAEVVAKLKNEGLLVGYNSRGPYAGGYTIGKPASIAGNTRRHCEHFFGSEEILCNAPCANLYPKDGKWMFKIWEFVPGPGPGDFIEEFFSIVTAVDAIIDYYFGNRAKMNPPEWLELEQE